MRAGVMKAAATWALGALGKNRTRDGFEREYSKSEPSSRRTQGVQSAASAADDRTQHSATGVAVASE